MIELITNSFEITFSIYIYILIFKHLIISGIRGYFWYVYIQHNRILLYLVVEPLPLHRGTWLLITQSH